MTRLCFCSKVVSGTCDTIKSYFANNHIPNHDSWLQKTPQGDFLIQCFEGKSKETLFRAFRLEIEKQNPDALRWHAFSQEVLGIEYTRQGFKLETECLLDLIVSPTPERYVKRSFVLPLLTDKEEEHRKSRRLAMGEKKAVHIAALEPFGVYRLTTWLQNTPHGKYIVAYSERAAFHGTSEERIRRGASSAAWQEVSYELMAQTGLKLQELSPDVTWLTKH